MAEDLTAIWKRLYQKNCTQWSIVDKNRYARIPNDPEDVDAEELQSCRELIEEINGKPPVE